MKTTIIRILDEEENFCLFFALKNEQWPLERLESEFRKKHKLSETHSLRGFFSEFIEYIKERNAVEIKIPTIILNSYPDPDYT